MFLLSIKMCLPWPLPIRPLKKCWLACRTWFRSTRVLCGSAPSMVYAIVYCVCIIRKPAFLRRLPFWIWAISSAWSNAWWRQTVLIRKSSSLVKFKTSSTAAKKKASARLRFIQSSRRIRHIFRFMPCTKLFFREKAPATSQNCS